MYFQANRRVFYGVETRKLGPCLSELRRACATGKVQPNVFKFVVRNPC